MTPSEWLASVKVQVVWAAGLRSVGLSFIRRTEVVFYSCLLPSSPFTSSISELRNCWDYTFGCVLSIFLSTTVLPSSY